MSMLTTNKLMQAVKKKGVNPQQVKATKTDYKLPDDILFEIKDCFDFYDAEKSGRVNRTNFKSILANFGFQGRSSKEIEEELKDEVDPNKQYFYLSEIEAVITRRWFYQGGREEEVEEMFKIFDKREKGLIGLHDIKQTFNQYLDFQIHDSDINEFIQETDTDNDGMITFKDFTSK